jgi:hypothetical protein
MALSLLGLIKWSLDLLVYCLQDIFDMVHELKGKENDREAIQAWSKSQKWRFTQSYPDSLHSL